MKLVIVESPTKAKTLSRFLGEDFRVESCQGHIRDLPKSTMGVDMENNFQPHYIIPLKKRKIVNFLKKAATEAETIYLASDEDREGEAIAWHLSKILIEDNSKKKKEKKKKEKDIDKEKEDIKTEELNKDINQSKFKRIAFHEITKSAILEAIKNPREINQAMVDAQQARRILDRLVGYELSPFLWKKIAKGLSAGRVQSPAVRLIVEREQEIKNFLPQEYWSIEAELKPQDNEQKFKAKLIAINDEKLDKLGLKEKEQVDQIVKELKKSNYLIKSIKEKIVQRNSLPPFATSTLQQESSNKLGFSAQQTMRIAQQLYEGINLGPQGHTGLITYMRTDSFNLSKDFISQAEKYLKQGYGPEFSEVHYYKTKAKVAQEAHEAIRPTSLNYSPEEIEKYLDARQYKLYDLIWRRALASQMPAAKIKNVAMDIEANNCLLRSNGQSLEFDGWLKLFPEKFNPYLLPNLKEKQLLNLVELIPQQHFTEPPPRYTDASLVKILEEHGIGRPSTYAPIIYTIQQRNYVIRDQRRFKPTEVGEVVNQLLVEHFPKIVDYQFTSKLEDQLDQIANNQTDWTKIIKEFYLPFKQNLEEKRDQIKKKEHEITDQKCPDCGAPLVIKMGRFGKFFGCSKFPDCRFTQSLNPDDNKSTGVKCPKCDQGEIISKRSRKGKVFYACNKWPDCKFALWNEPTGETCPECQSLITQLGQKTRCSNPECPTRQKKKKKDK